MMAGGVVLNVQKGVFRTNCIDCLDRTNVVHSMLAKKSLLTQLQVRMYVHTINLCDHGEGRAVWED